MNFLPVIWLIAFSVQEIFSTNILVILPLPYYSVTSSYMPIIRGLAARGHNVTLVSPFPQKYPVTNLTDIVFPHIDGKLRDRLRDRDPIKFFGGPWIQLLTLSGLGLICMKTILEENLMQKLISDTSSKYDLIIAQVWHLQEWVAAFGHKYNAPVIGISAKYITPLAAYLTGNYLPPSYLPVQTLPYTDRLTFVERAINIFHYCWYMFGDQLLYLGAQESLLREHFKYPGSENRPPLNDMLRNVSLTLMDSSITAIGYPTSLHKNIIEIGATNIGGKLQPLPADLQQFMDNATDGVILFSFGSIFNISELDSSKTEAIFSAFGKVKQKMLIKVERESAFINSTMPNAWIRPWLPQSSILAHPNCKLFITHCGLHSLMEAIYHSVPMVAIPMVFDQHFNAKLVETFGIGRSINIAQVAEEKLLKELNEVLENSSYKENINRRSAIMKDIPIDPLDNALYWIEYVIRHRGAPHLRPAVLDLHWYQYLMLDVIALYLLILVVIIYVIKTVLTLLWRCITFLIFKGKDSKNIKSE
ncbi:UDP-glycosyltransferase UGT4-like isoform X1 [Rhodnius prolixus]|uniref:UDP-glycosyltransferase UGT4-like isoform X1 n=1 Tax=Rhodnius prolixus TaxID=13249 RepID=UPI003D18A134